MPFVGRGIQTGSTFAGWCYETALTLDNFSAATLFLALEKHIQTMTDVDELDDLLTKWQDEGITVMVEEKLQLSIYRLA